MRPSLAIAVTASLLGLAVAAHARPQDDPKYIARMQEVAPRLEQDPALFDGERIPDDADLDAVARYLSLMASAIKTTDEQYRKLSPGGRQHPDVVRMMQRRRAIEAYHRAAAQALDAERAARKDRARAERDRARTDKAQTRLQCDGFRQAVPHGSGWEVVSYAVSQIRHYGTGEYKSVAEVEAARRDLDTVRAACDQFPAVDDACVMHGVGGDNYTYRAPELCDAARHADEVLAVGVTNYIVDQGGDAGVEYPDLEDVDKRHGWLSFEGPVTYDTHLYFTDGEKQRLRAKHAALLAAAGLENASDDTLWGKQVEYRDALRAKVDALAPTWPMEGGSACSGYGCKLARAAIARWHRGARVQAVTLNGSAWTVHHDERGRPESRTKEGFVLFAVPGANWCQLRSFTWEEPARGRGFARAGSVDIGYVRFQRCK